MNFKIEIDQLLAQELRQDLKAFRENMKTQVFQALTLLEAAILQNIRKGGLNVRTGKLLNSIGRSKRVKIDGENMVTGEIGPKGVPYAAIHEFGGTIVPKNARALTIPLPDNQRRDGTPKVTAREAFSSGRAFIKDGIIFQRKLTLGKGARNKGMVTGSELIPLFALKKSVTIPARPYLAPAIASTQDEILKNFGIFLAATFKKE